MIVEDGTDVENADSYVSLTFADGYFGAVSDGDWTGDNSTKEAALVAATRYFDVRWKFYGSRSNKNNDLEWPRDTDATLIPVAVRRAVCEYAKVALTESLWASQEEDESGRILTSLSEKVGPIEESKTFTPGGQRQNWRSLPAGDAYARRVARGGRVTR